MGSAVPTVLMGKRDRADLLLCSNWVRGAADSRARVLMLAVFSVGMEAWSKLGLSQI